MSAYAIWLIDEVTDMDALMAYREKAHPVVAKYEGRLVASSKNRHEFLEGEPGQAAIMFEFPSYERAMEWYRSDEYQAVKEIRENAVKTRCVIVEGMD